MRGEKVYRANWATSLVAHFVKVGPGQDRTVCGRHWRSRAGWTLTPLEVPISSFYRDCRVCLIRACVFNLTVPSRHVFIAR